MTTTPDRCIHSFPDPYPQPIDQPGDCRDCGITYQEAKDAAMTNPATELRAAVAHLHARLNDPELTPGPWLSMDHGDRLLWDGEGADDLPPRYVVDEPMSNGANADYIELMHPGIGTVLVRWLTDTASDIDANGGVVQSSSEDDALAVARLINERA